MSTLLLLVFSLSRIKVCHVGVSYERLGKAHTALLRFRSRILFRHLTRDQESFNLAQSLSIRVHGTIPDFAFNIFPDPEIKQSPAPAPAPALLLSFRTDQAKDQLNSAKALIDKLNDVYPENFLFNFYCQVERDRESTKTLHLHAKHNYKRQINFTDIQGDIEASLRFFKHNTHAISNRLHVLLMAASAGVKINAATYESFNQKTSNLLLEILNNADKKNSLIQLDGTNESLNTDNITFSITNQGSIEKQKLISDFSRIFRTQDTP
ncbi:Polysaccharide pyruvyl transferase [compost metagenome]